MRKPPGLDTLFSSVVHRSRPASTFLRFVFPLQVHLAMNGSLQFPATMNVYVLGMDGTAATA